jgi:hypothetical protein
MTTNVPEISRETTEVPEASGIAMLLAIVMLLAVLVMLVA